MYLKKINVKNFRKFDSSNHEFLLAKGDKGKIDISKRTTLVIGKNNSGKSSMIEAMKKVIIDNDFKADDFNYDYLLKFVKDYINNNNLDRERLTVPELEFIFTISIDDGSNDLLNNLADFISIDDTGDDDIDIIVKYQVKDPIIFKEEFDRIIKNCPERFSNNHNFIFRKFLDLINDSEFSIKYFGSNGLEVKSGFKLKSLINLRCINANNVTSGECLSKAFSKIINKEYDLVKDDDNELAKEIYNVNDTFDKKIQSNYSDKFNKILDKGKINKRYKLSLNSSLDIKILLQNVLKYSYIDGENRIPENQFGLGYTNLMMIASSLIEYIDDYPKSEYNSKINILTVEEPETYMHPQMQENLLKNLNAIINELISNSNKNINTQLIITSHSSHVLNSKIQTSNSFNNIDYINFNVADNNIKVINLNDDGIIKKATKKVADKNLSFIKKHITLGATELFFSDAIIIVEGVTEYKLLKYYFQEECKELDEFYISIFCLGGAHAKMYDGLIKTLGIPTLIITDVDLKLEKSKNEDEKYNRIICDNLVKATIKNETINYYKDNNCNVQEILMLGKFQIDNLFITFQHEVYEKSDEKIYATSFEEALILSNQNNKKFIEALKSVKPEVFKEINEKNIFEESTKIQNALKDAKSNFADTLLYQKIIDKLDFEFPKYIKDGIDFLKNQLVVSTGDENEQ